MPNKKGGYKIVSLKNINLLGVSLSLAGLYKALNDSYGKPIQICDINFNGTKKKDAFVLVEKLDAGVKINDLYGYDILVESDDDITVTANPQELPNTASATAGQILGLNAQKKPEWQDKPASGIKLYRHYFVMSTTSITVGGIASTTAKLWVISSNSSNTDGVSAVLGESIAIPPNYTLRVEDAEGGCDITLISLKGSGGNAFGFKGFLVSDHGTAHAGDYISVTHVSVSEVTTHTVTEL